ncbi:MAG: NUDIX domain-containing protein [Acidobacteriota bacterium]
MTRDLTETRIDGRRVYEGRIVAVEVDRVRLADGAETLREVVRHPGAVVVVPLRADGRVLLERQFRYPVGRVLLELPAGKLEPGEAPESCARRELAEEIGQAAAAWRPLARFFSAPGFCDEVMHCFLATGLTPVDGAEPDEDERIEVAAMPLAEAIARVESGEICDAKTVAALLLADRLITAAGVRTSDQVHRQTRAEEAERQGRDGPNRE